MTANVHLYGVAAAMNWVIPPIDRAVSTTPVCPAPTAPGPIWEPLTVDPTELPCGTPPAEPCRTVNEPGLNDVSNGSSGMVFRMRVQSGGSPPRVSLYPYISCFAVPPPRKAGRLEIWKKSPSFIDGTLLKNGAARVRRNVTVTVG